MGQWDSSTCLFRPLLTVTVATTSATPTTSTRRLAPHRAGRGSPLVGAAVRDGIEFQLAAAWPGDRAEERRLHRYRNSPQRLCPICSRQPAPDAPAGVTAAAGHGHERAL